MKREFSAGGIVFNDKGQVLLIQRSQKKDLLRSRSGDSIALARRTLPFASAKRKHWSFPKGLIDPGQTSQEAAIREVKEEGGVEAEILDKVGYSKYVYTLNEEKIFKIVTYFLMKYKSGSIEDHDWEVEETGWYELEDALKQLTFSQDKTLLKKALLLLKS